MFSWLQPAITMIWEFGGLVIWFKGSILFNHGTMTRIILAALSKQWLGILTMKDYLLLVVELKTKSSGFMIVK
jgi:hypothetical protein